MFTTAKFWLICSLLTGFVTFAATMGQIDIAALIGYGSAIGLAGVALYSRWREAKRTQDVKDREAARSDCEEARKAEVEARKVLEVRVKALEETNGELQELVEKWRALAADGPVPPPESHHPGRKRGGPQP